MSKYNRERNTEYARVWRKTARKILVENMGGKCLVCSYSSETAALDFHHLDPKIKKYEVSTLLAYKSWKRASDEARKCVILCCRCHREHHAGAVEIPITKVPEYSFPEKLSIRSGWTGNRKDCPVSVEELKSLRKNNSYDKLAIILSVNKRTVMRWCKESL